MSYVLMPKILIYIFFLWHLQTRYFATILLLPCFVQNFIMTGSLNGCYERATFEFRMSFGNIFYCYRPLVPVTLTLEEKRFRYHCRYPKGQSHKKDQLLNPNMTGLSLFYDIYKYHCTIWGLCNAKKYPVLGIIKIYKVLITQRRISVKLLYKSSFYVVITVKA